MEDQNANQAQIHSIRSATPVEIHNQQYKAHRAEADRHGKAAEFLILHPEFSEFLELLKAGVFA